MLWGHCIQYSSPDNVDFFLNGCYKFIYSFHMPLFMCISGYLFRRSIIRNSKNIKNRIVGIAQPLIIGNIVNYYIAQIFTCPDDKIKLSNFVAGSWLNGMKELWYLWALLMATICVFISVKVVKNKFVQLGLMMLLGILNLLVPNVNACLFVYPYFILGFIVNDIIDSIFEHANIVMGCTGIIFFVMLTKYQKKHYIYTTGFYSSEYSLWENIGVDLFRYSIGFFGCIFVVLLMKKIWKYCKNLRIVNAVAKLGQKSLQVYVMSCSLLSILLPKVFDNIFQFYGSDLIWIRNTFVFNFITTFSLAIIYAVGLFKLAAFLEKYDIGKIIFGR